MIEEERIWVCVLRMKGMGSYEFSFGCTEFEVCLRQLREMTSRQVYIYIHKFGTYRKAVGWRYRLMNYLHKDDKRDA